MINEKYNIEIKLRIQDIKQDVWNYLTKNLDNPFYKWEWLLNLENSKSVSHQTGWQPLYFLLYLDQELYGIAPLFLKNHSYGEFIFDQSFARLAQDLNLTYYPKLIGMSPYSPIEGYQFIYKEDSDKLEITASLLNYIEVFAKKNNILSCNFLYIDKEWEKLLNKFNYHKWINIRSQWESIGEDNFEEFLSRFNSNQRKNIKKERKSINNQKIKIQIFSENNINEDLMKRMHLFYEQHCLRWGVWGSKYLTDDFFKNCLKTKKNIIIFSAFEESSTKPIAMSMCVRNKENLWGRYWGSFKEINYLHFELCYYQPIDWAIKNKIKYFDPGAGGQHKRRRGFYAKETNSFHKWFNYDMENIIVPWLNKINQETLNTIENENDSVPFKK